MRHIPRHTGTDITRRRITSTTLQKPSQDIEFIYDPESKKVLKPPRFFKFKLITSIVLFLIIAATFVATRVFSLSSVIVSNSNDKPVELDKKLDINAIGTEADSRINILLLGVGDSKHAGADLSDSIMVASIDPHTKDVAMLGLPRDLYVNIPGFGYDKINAAHSLGQKNGKDEGPALSKKTVSETLGISIHYFVRTDFSGLKKAVDTLGGVELNVPSPLVDNEYPCETNESRVCGVNLKAGTYTMNGSLALQFARCRKGSCGNDFGRARRQQELLIAMRTKALSLPTLFNPAKINDLVSIVKDHVKTDISVDEMKKLYDLLHDIDPGTISTAVLDHNQNSLVTTANLGGLSVVIPTAGQAKYDDIRLYVRKLFFDGYIKRENIPVIVNNVSGRTELGAKVTQLLKSYNYNVTESLNLPASSQPSVIINNSHGQAPYTLKYLEKRFKLKATLQESPNNQSITLVIGSDLNPDYDKTN